MTSKLGLHVIMSDDGSVTRGHSKRHSNASFPGGWKETKMFLPHPFVKLSIVGSRGNREVAHPASDL